MNYDMNDVILSLGGVERILLPCGLDVSDDDLLAHLNNNVIGKSITTCQVRDQVLIYANSIKPTPEQLQAQANAEARAYLASTDWYVVRFAETGVAIPADIAAARQAARESVV